MAHVKKFEVKAPADPEAPVITDDTSDSVMREARETLRASQIAFLLSSFHALKLSFSPAESKKEEKVDSPWPRPHSYSHFRRVGFSFEGNSIFEVKERYVQNYSFWEKLCGIGFAFKDGEVIIKAVDPLTLFVGDRDGRETFVSDKKYDCYTPQILEGETDTALTTNWADIQFLPAQDSSIKPFTIKDLSNEERVSLQVMVGGVADLWKALGVQILSRKEEQARAKKIETEAELAREEAGTRARELELSREQIEALRTASAEKRGKTR
jgi:hypothetical protein